MGCSCTKSGAVQASEPLAGGKSRPKPSSTEIIARKLDQAKTTRVLALRECGLRSLPAGSTAPGTETFRTVDLGSNALKELPGDISVWTGCQKLLCSQNAIVSLPEAIGNLTALQRLELSGNRLRDIGSALTRLCNLQILLLDGNSLGPRLLESCLGGALATSLEELDLSSNGLRELPAALATLLCLVRLVLARNELTQLPDSLKALTKLKRLDVSDNKLVSVPAALLTECALLDDVWLKGNPMDRLQLQQTPGFETFLERRRQRINAKIDSHVVGDVNLAVCGLD